MAKRKKSKNQTKSEKVVRTGAPDGNESAEHSETTADSLTGDPPSAEAPNSAFPEEILPSAGLAEPTGNDPAPEAEYGQVWSENSGETTTEVLPLEEAVAGGESIAPADEVAVFGEEAVPAAESATEEVPAAAPQEASTEEISAEEIQAVWSDEAISPAATSSMDSGTGDMVPAEGDESDQAIAESRLDSILESLLFASDKPLGLGELKRLLGERDGKKVTAAVQALSERRKGTGIEVAALSSGWHLRTNPENAAWVSKLLVGRPIRLSRAMLETLAIVAYRQPITRPEVDDIRGVDCGPVLKTLLDRGLVRIIGKKEEVGRPMLYGTTPEFLRIFNLRDLSELPTLREFYDLSTEDQSRVEAEHGPPEETPSATTAKPDVALTRVMRGALEPEPEDTDPLLDELDEASQMAKQALGELEPGAPEPAAPEDEGASEASGGGGRGAGPEAPEGRGTSGAGTGPESPAGAAEKSNSESEAKSNQEPPASAPLAGE
jgi:segregation and condensation protein B